MSRRSGHVFCLCALKPLTLLFRWEHGKIEPPQGSAVFQRISEQVERKVRDVRTLFRKFDENCDGTVSHKEFRDGAFARYVVRMKRSASHSCTVVCA